ncbi:MAG: sigma-54 dependent transcriptional regulator [Thermodesulfobacteriota bacterium]
MNILLIDDEESMRHMLSVLLKKAGFDASAAENAEAGLKAMETEEFDFILCDIKMPGMGGLGFLKALSEKKPEQTVIMMSAYGTIESAIDCMKLGAYDFISKPFKTDEIILALRKAEERELLWRDNKRLKKEAAREITDIITQDKAMLDILALVGKVANYSTTVLVTGESGTGKELIARAIHFSGERSSEPFVAVNCGAIPDTLLESELFGYVKGAFTNAIKDKRGLFQEARGGTIFLDEIGELPMDLQVKLLRAIEEKEVRRIGDTRVEKIDVRVVSATARNLPVEIKEGRFREDLFYRLNVINVELPPLRERKGDIPLIALHFTKLFSARFAKGVDSISESAMKELQEYPWPGNVRELENVIERAVILEDGSEVASDNFPFKDSAGDLLPALKGLGYTGLSIKKGSEALERDLISRALVETEGNKSRAAKILEISHRALLYKIKNYKL